MEADLQNIKVSLKWERLDVGISYNGFVDENDLVDLGRLSEGENVDRHINACFSAWGIEDEFLRADSTRIKRPMIDSKWSKQVPTFLTKWLFVADINKAQSQNG